MQKVNEDQVNQSQPLATERSETLRAAQGDGQGCVTGRELDAALDLDLLPYEIAESLPTLGGKFGQLAAMCKSHVASHIEKMIKARQGRM